MKEISKIKYQKSKISSGFTLVELILYIAIVSIFLTGVIMFTWDIIYGRVKSYVQEEVNQNLRYAAKRITYEIRNASAVNLPVTVTSISLASGNAARNPTTIDISGGRLRIGYGNSGPCPITSPCFLTSNKVDVTNLTFINLSSGSDSINIKFSLTLGSVGQRREFQKSGTYESSVELRSH